MFEGINKVLLGLNSGPPPGLGAWALVISIAAPAAVGLVAMTLGARLPERVVKGFSLLGFVIPALGALFLWSSYNALGEGNEYAFELSLPLGPTWLGIQMQLGLNGISAPFFLLAGIVGLAAGVYGVQSMEMRPRLFLGLLLVMQSGLMGVFAAVDVFFFYVFHEFALVPTFLMIAIWGRMGRKSVAMELTVYLTLGAMLTLGGLIALYFATGAQALTLPALRAATLASDLQITLFPILLIGFGILVSLFPFHSWAPRGYATAPAPVAMLHAGVLKKFGLYGLVQIALPALPEGHVQWAPLLMWLALGNIIFIGFVTMAARDLKVMLGNASVMHMGYAFLGLFAFSAEGVGGALMMMFAHGLSVALLFLLADIVERRAGTTDMRDLGGLGEKAPVLMGFFIAAIMASIGLPGFANFWGELTVFAALFNATNIWVLAAAVAGIVISAIYGLRAVSQVFYGKAPEDKPYSGDMAWSERIPAVLLLGALLVAGLWPRSVGDSIDRAVQADYPSQHSELVTQMEEPQ